MIIAIYDAGEWSTIQSNIDDVLEFVKERSKRSGALHGVFENPYMVGNMILDKPQILFLHGIRYNRDESIPLEVIVDNARYMGL